MPDLPLEHFRQLCHAHGHFTRLVPCALLVEYAPYTPDFEAEYLQLEQRESARAWQTFSHGKDHDAMLFKALSDIYEKLTHLEQALQAQQQPLLPLESQGVLCVLGHGVMGVQTESFTPPCEYYLRFKLAQPYQILVAIARAFDRRMLSVVRMHASHVKEMDSYIAAQELASLKGSKTCN
ncbi:hypothetical protein ACFOPX_00430 [Helicobacter baculiformis]|uniref:Uncharacterized protein n=1 Tax=Helicobacter baculiformis TaxID=427351 RepID=A0ABV7ZEM3_9HELI|nr:hypothetical protein [Helicobacter baculiformis]